jgi:mono/diheme cytochrome c family protein
MPRHLVIFAALNSLAIAQEKVTYEDHVLPLFQQACLNCHNPDKTKGGLDLSSFTGTIKGSSGGKIVEPGDPNSALITVVMQTAEPKMPPEGEKLPNDQIQILKRWIETGLLENASSSGRKASKPKFETTPRSDPSAKPDGPPPMPAHLLLDPPVVTAKASAVNALAASPWAPLLAVTSQRQVLLVHTETLELIGILPFNEGDPVSTAFTPDARYLIVGGGVPGKSGVTVTFDVTTGTRLLNTGKEFDSILASDIRPGFDIVATGGPSRLLKLWNTGSGALIKSIKKHTDWITSLDISPDGVLLASGDRNGGVHVWESETASEFHTLRAHQAAITAAIFRSDSNILATSSEDGTVRFWEMNGGSEVKKIDAHPGGVTALSFARDGSSLTAGRDSKVKLWKPDFTAARDIAQNLPALPTAVALDAEGKRAFVGDARGTVLVFNTADGKALGEIQSNPPTIEARLQTINSQIAAADQSTAAANHNLTTKTADRDKARQALTEAEHAHHQSLEIHKAAQSGAAQTPNAASSKLVEDAAAHIAAAALLVKTRRADLEAAEKSLTEATAARDAAQVSLTGLKSAQKRWSAAAINTRLLATRRLAETSSNTTEESQLAFTEASRKVTQQAEALNHKRGERSRLASRNDTATWSPEALAELTATLAAIDIVVARELEHLRSTEAEFVKLARAIDPNALSAQEKKIEAESLQQAYHKALE